MRLALLAAIALLSSPLVACSEDSLEGYVDEIFFNYDSDHDQYLNRKESTQFFREAYGLDDGEKIDEAKFSDWHKLIDANSDGLLSWKEIFAIAKCADE